MADNKKYYYMRLKENFFDTDEMVYLESLEEGYKFSNILLKLYLRSLKNEGILMMNKYVPYNAKMISNFTGHSLSTVEKALFEFKNLRLIEILDSGQMYMSNIELFVGRTTTEADRKRHGRLKAEKKLEIGTNVGQMSDKSIPELELELELEKELEKELSTVEVLPKKQNKKNTTKYSEEHLEVSKRAIDYLNQQANKNFRHTDNNIKLIVNILKQDFKPNDIKYVIDVKVDHWLNDDEHNMYLRPQTLFGNKFESYLNQQFKSKKPTQQQVVSQPPAQKIFDPSQLFAD